MNSVSAAFQDFVQGARLAPLWLRLGWEQVVARFRRTVLGPFWLSANLLAISFSLSLVFGGLLGQNYRTNLAQIVSGILCWALVGGVLGEAASVFIGAAGLMQTQRLPLTFHVFLLMHRALINFLAQLIAFWLVMIVLRLGALPSWQFLLGLPVVLVDSFLLSLIIGIPSTRFRDVNQLVGFVVQILFFLTPVFWVPSQLVGNRGAILRLNPLGHVLELIRQPLLGRAPVPEDWIVSIGWGAFLAVVALVVLVLYRRRLVFWL